MFGTAKAVGQSIVELVSAERLLNLGRFRITVGDFGRACQPFPENGSAEMKPNGQNGPEWRVLHDSLEGASGDRTGWLGWQDFEPPHGGIKIHREGATDPATSRQEPYNCLSVIDLETARSDSGRRDFAFW